MVFTKIMFDLDNKKTTPENRVVNIIVFKINLSQSFDQSHIESVIALTRHYFFVFN